MKRTHLLVAISALLTITMPLYAQQAQPDPAADLITRTEATAAFTKLNTKVNTVRDSLRATNNVAHQALARASAPTQTVVRQVRFTGDGQRTMKALGVAAHRRGKAQIEAVVRAEVMKLVDGDTSKVASHPYYQFRMKELTKSGMGQAYADAFVADLIAVLDRPAPVVAPPAPSEKALENLTERVEHVEVRLADTENALQETLRHLGGYAKTGKRKELAKSVGQILANYKP